MDGIDWGKLVDLAAPIAGAVAVHGQPGGDAGFLQGLAQGRELARQHQLQNQNITTARNQQAGDYLLKIGEHAQSFDDPVELAQFSKLAEEAGVKAGFLKPGDLAGKFTVAPSKLAHKRLTQLTDQLDALDKAGYNLDDLATSGAHVRLQDGTDVPVATALDLTNRRPVDATGQRIARTDKVGNTEEERFLAKRAKDYGYKSLDQVDADTQLEWRQDFRGAGQKVSTAPDQRAIELRKEIRDAQAKGDTATAKTKQQEYNDIVGALSDLGSARRKPDTGLPTDIQIKPGTREYRIATDLASGDLTYGEFTRMLTARGSGPNVSALRMAIYDTARDLNPNFSPAQFEMGYKFATNPKVKQQVASINNVMSGVDDLLKISDRATRSGVPLLNSFLNKGGYAVSGKNYANLAIARKAFADELSGALGYGSATDMSRAMGMDMTDPNLSPEDFRNAVQTVVVPFVQRKKASLVGQMGVYGGGDASGGGSAPARVYYDTNGNPVVKR
jgi:hypothetical protein